MRVLVACEESQEVCKAFRELGHEAFSCDIIECSGGHPEWHILDDVLNHLNDGWDMLIGFPPCTFITKAGACRLYHNGDIVPARLDKLYAARDFFFALWNANVSMICLENPTPMHIANLPKPSQIIEPYFFGDGYMKRTCLWLKNLPPLFSTEIVAAPIQFIGGNGHPGVVHSQKDRSKTFPGVAKAMASQWGCL